MAASEPDGSLALAALGYVIGVAGAAIGAFAWIYSRVKA